MKISDRCYRRLVGFCFAAVGCLILQASSWAQSSSLCENRGYVVGFFNGVWNTPDEAEAGAQELRLLIGNTYLYFDGETDNAEPVKYEPFYNHTGATVGATRLQDLAETFIQRANEIDASGALAGKFEYLWEVLSGERSFWDRLIEVVPAVSLVLDTLYQDFLSTAVEGYARMLSDPPTASDHAEHIARLDTHALQGQKMLLVAHSQGNLFVNMAYDYIAPKVDANSVKVVHIAPASPTVRGAHVLADIDLIINALRIQGLNSVPNVNLLIPTSRKDWSGHTLVDTYLDDSRFGRTRVSTEIELALGSLVTPDAEANLGFFTVTLTWNGSGDVDLHTFEPNGTHVYYSNLAGSSGFLDVDNTIADGPEHYFATCDPNQLQVGTYRIGINNYARATGRVATVQAASVRTGVLITRTLDVGPERGTSGNGSPIPVLQVTVSQDNEQFKVNAQ